MFNLTRVENSALTNAFSIYWHQPLTCLPPLFIYKNGSNLMFLLIYVDNILIIGPNPLALTALTEQLQHDFALKDLDPIHYFLGINISDSSSLFLSQQKYITDLLKKTNMLQAKPMSSLMSTTTNLQLLIRYNSNLQLTTFFDADWAGCPNDLRSVSGYCVFLDSNLLSWS